MVLALLLRWIGPFTKIMFPSPLFIHFHPTSDNCNSIYKWLLVHVSFQHAPNSYRDLKEFSVDTRTKPPPTPQLASRPPPPGHTVNILSPLCRFLGQIWPCFHRPVPHQAGCVVFPARLSLCCIVAERPRVKVLPFLLHLHTIYI